MPKTQNRPQNPVPFSIQAIDTIHGQIALPNAAEPLVVRWADAPGSRRRDSREKGGKQKGQRQGGMGGMGGMGGLMMMGGGGEAGQGYNKQNPYAYGEPPRIDPPTHPCAQTAQPWSPGCSPCPQAAAAQAWSCARAAAALSAHVI